MTVLEFRRRALWLCEADLAKAIPYVPGVISLQDSKAVPADRIRPCLKLALEALFKQSLQSLLSPVNTQAGAELPYPKGFTSELFLFVAFTGPREKVVPASVPSFGWKCFTRANSRK